MVTIAPLGKWLQVSRDDIGQVVILPDGAPIGCLARVEALGPQCDRAAVQVGARILVQTEGIKTFSVDGASVFVVHEDHVIGVLP